MSEYVKIKRSLYDELVDIKARYLVLCKTLEVMESVYQDNKPKETETTAKLDNMPMVAKKHGIR